MGVEDLTTDIHGVTHWTKLGTTWTGVPVGALLDDAGVGDFDFALVSSYGDYTTNTNHDHSHVDGNAVIGALSLALGTDAAAVAVVCGSCGDHYHVAETRVYLRCPGTVSRRPNSGGVGIVLVEIDHRIELTIREARLDLTGATP